MARAPKRASNASESTGETKTTASVDVSERIAYAALGPLARIASRIALPLRRAKQLTELAYYQEARRRGFKIREIQDLMSVGFSKAGSLSRQLKDYFSEPDLEIGLQRRVLLLLWGVPLTRKRIASALEGYDAEEVDRTIDRMLAEGRLEEVPGRTTRYQVVVNHQSLVEDRWIARVEALNSLMTTLAQTVEARFFESDDRAFVRNLSFRVRPEDLPKLQALYREQIIPLIQELDGAVESEDDTLPLRLAVMWTPDSDRMEDRGNAEDGEDE